MTWLHIGKKLKALRKNTGLSQQAFADELGVHRRSYQNWEIDKSAVDNYKAEGLLKAAGKIARKRRKKR